MSPETALRQRLVDALAPEIKVEPVESGAVNPGFLDVLLAIPGADGLWPVELKVGKISNGVVRIEYRADQNAKSAELRQRIRNVWTLIYADNTYFLIRDYRPSWLLREITAQSVWFNEDLSELKRFLLDRAKRH